VKETFEDWLRNNTFLLERTIRLYVRTIERFKRLFGNPTIENINRFIIESTKERRSYYVKYVFRLYLKYLGREEDYPKLVKVRQKAKKRIGCYLAKEEIMRIIDLMTDKTYRIVALIQFLTGARAHDVLSFNSKNLVRQNDDVWLGLTPKGEKRLYYVFIPKKHAKLICDFIESSGKEYPFLKGNIENFVNAVNNNYRYYYNEVKNAAKFAGYPDFSTHDFRRNFIEDIYSREKDLRVIKDIAGHSNIRYTMQYLKQHFETRPRIKKLIEEIRG
jgi:integrase